MTKSLISDVKACYVCGTTYNVEKHHIYAGSYRKKSEKYGAWCYLCAYHHRLEAGTGAHNPAPYLDKKLKILAQKKFEQTHTHKEFMEIFNRNYLEE